MFNKNIAWCGLLLVLSANCSGLNRAGTSIHKTSPPSNCYQEAIQDLMRFNHNLDEELVRCGGDEYLLRQQAGDAAIEKYFTDQGNPLEILTEDEFGVRWVLTKSQEIYKIPEAPSFLGYSKKAELKCVQGATPYNIKKVGRGAEAYTALF